MHIKDFVLIEKFGGGFADWDFLEEIDKHCYNEFGFDMNNDLENMNHIHDLFGIYFDKIKEEWEKFISEKEGKKIELELEYFFNYLDSHIDLGGDYHWSDSKEEVYEIWKNK